MVPKEYAARTVCSLHTRRCTDSLRGRFYSECEERPAHNYVCKYSHTILNTKRILRLGKNSPVFSIRLEYGYGFERYGIYDNWTDGWDVFVNGLNLGSAGSDEKTYNLPKSVLLSEHKLDIKTFNPSADKADAKVQSICRSTHDRGFCRFKDQCRYDHDLIDSRRLERLVGWADEGMSPHRDYMTVECRVEGGAPTWRITLKPDAIAKLGLGSNRIEEAYEGEDLLGVVRRMERVVGLKREPVVQSDTIVQPTASHTASSFVSPFRRRLPQPPYTPASKWRNATGRLNEVHGAIAFDFLGYSKQGVPMRELSTRSAHALASMIHGAGDVVLAHTGLARITLRIIWPGYEHVEWARSVEINLAGQGPVTRAQLGAMISQNFARYIEKTRSEPARSSDWHLGPSGIRYEHMVLVALCNVFEDVWQADVAVDLR